MPERAHPQNSIWSRRYGLFPTPALRYLIRRYSFCRRFVQGQRVLEVPCGTGMGSIYLGRPAELVGIDYSMEAIDTARHNYGNRYSRLDCGSMDRLPYKAETFDVVLCLEGIEHVQKDIGVAFLQEAQRVLRKHGTLVISCPIGGAGIHSGNEFHLYEWGRKELQEAVSVGFHLEQKWVLPGPQGQVQILVGKRLDNAGKFPSYGENLQLVHSLVQSWHLTVHRKDGGAAYATNGKEGLLPTCFSVLLHEALGTLATLDFSQRNSLANYIRSYQDAATGMFSTQLVKSEDLSWGVCDLSYVRHQVNYFAISALDSLGAPYAYPLRFAEPFLDANYCIGWLDGGPWHDPWNQSNRAMFLMRYLISLREAWEKKGRIVLKKVLEYLDAYQSDITGLWHGTSNAPVRNALFAAYHFYPFYLWYGVKPAHIENAIDATLSIQHTDGLFGTMPGGGACEDLDAIDVLVKLSYLTNHRWSDVATALKRAYFRILQIQNEDGGFPNYPMVQLGLSWKRRIARRFGLENALGRPAPTQPTLYYSGWKTVGSKRGESDLWGAWFRVLALKLIAERVPELGPYPGGGRFHAYPALGWHDRDPIIALGITEVR